MNFVFILNIFYGYFISNSIHYLVNYVKPENVKKQLQENLVAIIHNFFLGSFSLLYLINQINKYNYYNFLGFSLGYLFYIVVMFFY